MNNLSKILVFSMILFIGLGVACAASADDANIQDTQVSSVDAASVSPVNNVVEDTSSDNNLIVERMLGIILTLELIQHSIILFHRQLITMQ